MCSFLYADDENMIFHNVKAKNLRKYHIIAPELVFEYQSDICFFTGIYVILTLLMFFWTIDRKKINDTHLLETNDLRLRSQTYDVIRSRQTDDPFNLSQ